MVDLLLGRWILSSRTQAGTKTRETRLRLTWATVFKAFSLRMRRDSCRWGEGTVSGQKNGKFFIGRLLVPFSLVGLIELGARAEPVKE